MNNSYHFPFLKIHAKLSFFSRQAIINMESNLFMLRRKISPPTPESSEDFHLLEGLDSAVDSLLSIGKIKKGSDCMNQALKIRINVFGDSSKEVIEYISFILKKTASSCTGLIERGKTQTCIELLRNLLVLANNYPLNLIANETCEVYNTLACALRKHGKPKIAKKYAMKALALANSFKTSEKIASSIYLNLCAIFSSLNQHKEASVYCSQAVQLAQEDLLNLKLSQPDQDYQQEVAVLAVAYHNLGVEEEYLRHYEVALAWYRKAIKFLEKHASASHMPMLEEFRKSYEDAQKTCKKKFQKIRLERSLKEDYFYDESSGSMSDIEMKIQTQKVQKKIFSQTKVPYSPAAKSFAMQADLSKSQKNISRVPSIPMIPNLSSLSRPQRSDSSESINRASDRHKKLLELDSDIRELDNLGLLEHEKSSKRSKSSFRSGELSPIKKDVIKKNRESPKINTKPIDMQADYQEKVVKKRKEDSYRSRKIIKDVDQHRREQITLKAVLKIQNFFRAKRVKKWYNEIKQGKLFGLMLKCEKIINKYKYLVSFTIKKSGSSLSVVIEAQPLSLLKVPEPGKYTLFEICNILNSWDTTTFEIKKSELLIYINIENGKVILRKNKECSLEILYQGSKQLNNMFTYQISIYNVKTYIQEPSLLIDARPLKKSPPIIRVFIISKREMANILSVKLHDLQQRLDKVIELVIIEGEGELSLSKRSINDESPLINICTTNTDDYTDQYKQYENTGRGRQAESPKHISFVVGKNDLGKAAVVIQSLYRCKKERRNFLKLKEIIKELGLKCTVSALNKAVILMQAFVRRWRQQKKYREMQKARNNKRKPKSKEEKAAILLQSHTRGWLIRKKFPGLVRKELCLSIYEQRLANAAIYIQKRFRGWKTRKSMGISKEKMTPLRAITIIQKKIRIWLQHRKKQKVKSIVYIQSHVRGWLTRNVFNKNQKNTLSLSFVKINTPKSKQAVQKFIFNPKQMGKTNDLSTANRLKAITVIQKFIKGHKARKEFLNMKKSALCIQKNFRRYSAEKVFKQKMKEKAAIALIQRNVKRWLKKRRALKKKKKMPQDLKEASIVIQKNFKAHAVRKEYLKIKNMEKSMGIPGARILWAVKKVQKVFRGHRDRKQVKMIKELNKGLSKIPKKKLLDYVIMVQRRFRSYMLRKKFRSLVELIKKFRSGTTANQMFKAITAIQKWIRGWIIRRYYRKKPCLPNTKYIKAVLLIQKLYRGWKARKEIEEMKSGGNISLRIGVLINKEPYLLSIGESKYEFIVKSTHFCKMTSLYLRVPKTGLSAGILAHRLTIKNGYLKVVEPSKPKNFKQLILNSTKIIGKASYNASIYFEPSQISIIFINDQASFSGKFLFGDLMDRYSEKMNLQELLEDLTVSKGMIVMKTYEILLQKDKKIKDKIYKISMFAKESYLYFEISLEKVFKKCIKVLEKEAEVNTGVKSGRIQIGHYIIDKCLAVKNKKIFIIYKKKPINLLGIVIRLQAAFRGHLARKRLKQDNLILITEKNFKSQRWALNCFYNQSKFTIIATCVAEQITFVLEKRLSQPQVGKFLRKTLIPGLFLTETTPKKLIFKPMTPNSEKITGRAQVGHTKMSSTGPLNQKAHVPLNFVASNPNMSSTQKNFSHNTSNSIIEKSIHNSRFTTSGIIIKSNPDKNLKFDEMSNPVTSEPLSPEMTPTVTLKKSTGKVSIVRKSAELVNIVLKTGLNISGIYLIVTMELKNEGIYVKANNETGLISLDLFVKTKRVRSANEKDVEDLCTELLSQLKIISDVDGRMRLALIDSNEEEKDQVIYRRSHYISARYFTITIYENYRGVYLEATENDKNVFNMKLGRRRVGNSQKIQEELSELVKKLKIEVVLGQEMLVLSTV